MSHRRGALNDQFLGDAVGLIFSLALLVLDDAALHVEPSPVDGSLEMAHPVGLDPQGNVQRVAIYGANGTILRKGATFISAGSRRRCDSPQPAGPLPTGAGNAVGLGREEQRNI